MSRTISSCYLLARRSLTIRLTISAMTVTSTTTPPINTPSEGSIKVPFQSPASREKAQRSQYVSKNQRSDVVSACAVIHVIVSTQASSRSYSPGDRTRSHAAQRQRIRRPKNSQENGPEPDSDEVLMDDPVMTRGHLNLVIHTSPVYAPEPVKPEGRPRKDTRARIAPIVRRREDTRASMHNGLGQLCCAGPIAP